MTLHSKIIQLFIVVLLMGSSSAITAQVQYPYPVQYISVSPEGKAHRMAYMDIKPAKPSAKTIVLLHGKNFNGYYWKDVIAGLTKAGYRVIVPDQVGWGRSDRAYLHYSFHMLAANTKALLDSLNITATHILGHSMGGMLATRFTLMYPEVVTKLILENPIGLEDYKTFVPYQPLSKIYEKEKKATYASYKKYQETYYPEWKPEYEQFVAAQADDLTSPNFAFIAWVNALTYQMIYEQPVVYEFHLIRSPTLLIIGELDRTIVGKDQLSEDAKKQYGQYPSLAKKINKTIDNSQLTTFPGSGHIPHIQENEKFNNVLIKFLEQ